MELSLPERVRIDALLLAREEQFVRVHACETAIDQILGAPYPFPPPPPLPSQQKRRTARKKPAEGQRPGSAQSPPLQLPVLGANEIAYRLTYRQDDLESSEDHPTALPLERWLARPGAGIQTARIETVKSDGTVARKLWTHET